MGILCLGELISLELLKHGSLTYKDLISNLDNTRMNCYSDGFIKKLLCNWKEYGYIENFDEITSETKITLKEEGKYLARTLTKHAYDRIKETTIGVASDIGFDRESLERIVNYQG